MFVHRLTDDAALRLIEPRRAEELYALIERNRERLRPWMTFVEYATSPDAERAFATAGLRQFADGRGFHCDILYRGKLAGGIGMMPVNRGNRSVEIGYWLDADAVGKGLVTVSCRAIVDHCFNVMDLNRVVIRTAPGNILSQAVAKRLGAAHEATLRQTAMLEGRLIDQEVFSLLKAEWREEALERGEAFFSCRLTGSEELGLLEPRHAGELFALIDRNREHLRRWLPFVDGTVSPSDSQAFITRTLHEMAEKGTTVAGIWYCGALAGTIGLHAEGDKRAEIGYWLGEEFQGRGLVTSACQALIRYAFDDLGVQRICIRAAPENLRSRAIPERLGFTCEGTLRQTGMNGDGTLLDLMVYSLLKDEWETMAAGH